MTRLTTLFRTTPFTRSRHPVRLGLCLSAGHTVRELRSPALLLLSGIAVAIIGLTAALPAISSAATGAIACLTATVLGIAACRSIVVRFADNRTGSISAAMRFAISHTRHAIVAALLPGIAFILFSTIGLATQQIGMSMSPFDTLGQVVLVVAASIWPLILAAIAVESCDGLDATSRVLHFILSRPLLSLARLTIGWVPLAAVWLLAQNAIGPLWELAALLLAIPATTIATSWFVFTYLHLREVIDAIECDELESPHLQTRIAVPLCGRAAHPVGSESVGLTSQS